MKREKDLGLWSHLKNIKARFDWVNGSAGNGSGSDYTALGSSQGIER